MGTAFRTFFTAAAGLQRCVVSFVVQIFKTILLCAGFETFCQYLYRNLVTVDVQITAFDQNTLQTVANRSHFGFMEQRYGAAIFFGDGAAAYRAFIPHHFAHISQCLRNRTAGTRCHRQQTHTGGNPLLTIIFLTGRHEEFKRTFNRHALTTDHAFDMDEADRQIHGFFAFIGGVLHFGGD